ncbi:hypothetical protein [Mucilaginibacter pedocola]|uniref:Uncharacterized protein n=1 Tax=Mucilaginibacter pedocola TaxID=1792845 RepID=A0A1S9PC37_9SPHI|nr:hypothetical protein [Mucilaginibacter pedocola]OOQ58481.1 hypothetical protein BC343_07360 [Mucilaginibacter pedocola]
MDQNIDNRHKEILWDLLANPAENGQLYKHNLERLVQDNPQSGLLQVMYARSLQTPDIQKASAYFSPKTLHKLMHDADGLLPVSRDRVNKYLNGHKPAEPENYFNIGTAPETAPVITDEESDAPVNIFQKLSQQAAPQPVDNFTPTEELLPAHDEPPMLPQHEEENTFHSDTIGFIPEPEQSPAPLVTYIPPVEIPVAATAYAQPAQDEDDDEYANPWDLSKLDEKEAVNAPEPVKEEIAPAAEAAPQPVAEIKTEPAAEIPAEPAGTPIEVEPIEEIAPAPLVESLPQPEATAITEEPKVETYDHSLSVIEPIAVEKPAEAPKAEEETTSFNVFHKQDEIKEPVYDEIVSIDAIGIESLGNTFAESEHTEQLEEADANEEAIKAQENLIADETERLMYGNIAATDYLSFDKKLDELRAGFTNASTPTETAAQPVAQVPAPEPTAEPAIEAAPEPVAQFAVAEVTQQPQIAETAKDPERVSKYDDDTLPYSFLWWLDKTRKEHAGSTRPYAQAQPQGAAIADNIKAVTADGLQQQYFANIFSLTSVSSVGDIEPPQIAFDPEKKEDVIIERFIHNDPQIKPLAADKLDNENKARRSSEDQDAMVTETLARIYGDQMLYHKAIATYKKLMLKIPEKKTYFATQIEQLEKKIN